jgi:UDP-glucose 4-epimerase
MVDRLLEDEGTSAVTIYDNFSSGREWHVAHRLWDPRLQVIRADVAEEERLTEAMAGHDVVVHLASNPDIARAAVEPAIDFVQGTLLTHNVVEAMRRTRTGTILYASGSGVYGDLGWTEIEEDHGPLLPVSTYGASKLAGEALITSYCFMFGLRGLAFRFANVVGPRQTHGVGFDFVRKLAANPSRLVILGNGTQNKAYVHVDDILDAVLLAERSQEAPFGVYNVATDDQVTVKEIADLAVECLGIDPGSVSYDFTGGDRGWKGDVPVVRLATERIRSLGWKPGRSSREALRDSILSMLDENRPERS